MTIYIHNPGTLDLAAITTFGISVKEGNNPIGFFGTGLKYAIAVTLRLGGEVSIRTGATLVRFETVTDTFRDKEFDFIDMVVSLPSGDTRTRLPFTTELGKTWEPWQALREFICNAVDEGGCVIDEFDAIPKDGVVIGLDCDAYRQSHLARFSDIFLPERDNGTEFPNVTIYPYPSKHLYYRGVRVHDFPKPANFTYNVTGTLDLTEDRTVKYPDSALSAIFAEIVRYGSAPLAARLCSAQEYTVEGDVAYSHYWTYGEDFVNGVRAHRKSGGVIPRTLFSALIGTLVKDTQQHCYTPTAHEAKMLEVAMSTLAAAGHPITSPIHLVETLGPMTMGQVLDREIYIAREAFNMGTRQLMGTLFEEQLHISKNVFDLTRQMQNTLIDLLMGEFANKTGVVL